MENSDLNIFEIYVLQISDLVEKREKYQRLLGKIASEATQKYGPESLKQIAHLVQETTGRKLSLSTLRNYRWTYERVNDLKLPEDLSYYVLQKIASSENPKGWARRIKKEGLSSNEVARLFRGEKEKKTVICYHCQREIEI